MFVTQIGNTEKVRSDIHFLDSKLFRTHVWAKYCGRQYSKENLSAKGFK